MRVKPFRLSRGGEPYKRLQIAVLERDDYTCQQFIRPTESPPHHIQKLSQGGADVIENMVSLCVTCHDNYPNRKRRVE